MNPQEQESKLNPQELEFREKEISRHFRAIMELLDMDLENESLKDTPDRVAKMYSRELFRGMHEAPPRIMTVSNQEADIKYNQMLVERDIKVQSVCEHHFVPIIGVAHVAYIPKDKVIGLSKLNRIVDFFCRKPQVQERLTEEIHEFLCKVLDTENVAVIVDAKHYCVIMRGIKDINSSTVTSKMGGVFEDTEARKELLSLIKLRTYE